MKTRLKNRIAGFSREQLIDWICLSCVDIRSTHSAEDAQDMINDIRGAIEIGFPAALTEQPVKLPKREKALIGRDYLYVYCAGPVESAIRAAGYEVAD